MSRIGCSAQCFSIARDILPDQSGRQRRVDMVALCSKKRGTQKGAKDDAAADHLGALEREECVCVQRKNTSDGGRSASHQEHDGALAGSRS